MTVNLQRVIVNSIDIVELRDVIAELYNPDTDLPYWEISARIGGEKRFYRFTGQVILSFTVGSEVIV